MSNTVNTVTGPVAWPDQGRAGVPGHCRRAHRLLRAGPGPGHQGGGQAGPHCRLLGLAAALGLAFVGDVIASTAGVKPADAGLASGLINTSQQIGGAVGLAVTTTVAAARTASLLRAGHPAAVALTGGFHEAFAVTGGLALAAALLAATFVGRARGGPGPGPS